MIKDFILHLRKKRNLTKEFLASEIGVTRPTYDKIERGKSDMTIPQAQKLAAVLGISFEDFVREKETVVFAEIEKGPKSAKKEKDEIRISVPQQKVDKFNVVLKYILKKVGGKPNVGMTVLYKLLYFIDFDYYEKYEEQLMGLTYLKNQY
ncbi:MAG: helix-turn-helix domain-containing protein, partial [Flavobacterium sp.]|nr:helix-turn-helix domain-containing protein [Flavobacterium sp.]